MTNELKDRIAEIIDKNDRLFPGIKTGNRSAIEILALPDLHTTEDIDKALDDNGWVVIDGKEIERGQGEML